MPVNLTCQFCGKPFSVIPSRQKTAKFCSQSCLAKSKTGPRSTNWKGGIVRHHGEGSYLLVYSPDHPNVQQSGYVFQHRLVMEEHLGRLLRPDEHVHHINEIKDDNRIENLELLTHAEHTSRHFAKQGWSREHHRCIECGKTDSRHAGQGRCHRCYERARMNER